MVAGLSGQRMLIGLLIGIALLIFLVLKTKVQAFLALILCTIVVGLVGGMPLANTTIDGKTIGIVNSVTSGFGGTLGSIGIIIGFGVMMGQIFEATGAAKRMAYTFLKLFGKGREEEALAITGFVVSIPIFCDSGFVVLSPIAKALSKVTKKSVVALGVSLAAGLVVTHSLVPPTPGPLGVCGIFGIDVGIFLLLTLVLSVPMVLCCILYARKVLAKKYYKIVDEKGAIVDAPYQEADKNAKLDLDMDGVPGALESFGPLLLPIILILINTVSSALGFKTGIFEVLIFLGQPIVAVGLGLLLAIFTLGNRLDRTTALKEMGFDKVYDTNFAADLTIMEEATEFVHRVKEGGPLPLITSCSPGWVKYCETFYPEFIPNISSCKSPQQMFGAITKTYYAKLLNVEKDNIDVKNINKEIEEIKQV